MFKPLFIHNGTLSCIILVTLNKQLEHLNTSFVNPSAPKCFCVQLKCPSVRWGTAVMWPHRKRTLPLVLWVARRRLPVPLLLNESVHTTGSCSAQVSVTARCVAALTWERQSCRRIPQCNGGTVFWHALRGSLWNTTSHRHQNSLTYIKYICSFIT